MYTCPSKSSRTRTRPTWCRQMAGERQAPWGLSVFKACPLLSSSVSSCPLDAFAQIVPTRPCTLSLQFQLSCCSLILLTVPARNCRGHWLPHRSRGALDFTSETSLLPSRQLLLKASAPVSGDLHDLLSGLPAPSQPISPPFTHSPRGSQSAPSKAQTRPCCPWDPSVLSPYPGLALALQHHVGRSLLEPSQQSS